MSRGQELLQQAEQDALAALRDAAGRLAALGERGLSDAIRRHPPLAMLAAGAAGALVGIGLRSPAVRRGVSRIARRGRRAFGPLSRAAGVAVKLATR
jgi:hypothetical protein